MRTGPASTSAREAVERALARVDAREADVRAWAHLDAPGARRQADELDARARQDPSLPERLPLWGLTVGLKDIIDTSDLPTENGTVLHAGRRPDHDAVVVQQLREGGALILGKTITTELATYAPGPTRNPWNLAHTPGGSSSGSAAAVACGMVDVALGSQTNGSTIRPAAFCGVYGFKPGRARISREGMLMQSPSFDTVGLFASRLDDLVRLYRCLRSSGDPSCAPSEGASSAPSEGAPSGPRSPRHGRPRVAWWSTPWWSRIAEPDQVLLLGAARAIGSWDPHQEVQLDRLFPSQRIVALHGLIMEAEIARSFASEFERGQASLSTSLQGQIMRGRATSDAQWQAARSELAALGDALNAAWPSDIDVIALPSAAGTAPEGLSHTGDPIFCTLATALDWPALNLPGCQGANGLPLGVQLLAPRGQEERLLQAAAALAPLGGNATPIDC